MGYWYLKLIVSRGREKSNCLGTVETNLQCYNYVGPFSFMLKDLNLLPVFTKSSGLPVFPNSSRSRRLETRHQRQQHR